MLSKAHSIEQLRNALLQKIQEHGFALASSEKTADRDGMVHTIGLWASAGHPEFVIFGDDLNGAENCLNELARRVIQGERIEQDAEGRECESPRRWSQSEFYLEKLSADRAEMPQAMSSWTLGACAAASNWVEIKTLAFPASAVAHSVSSTRTPPASPLSAMFSFEEIHGLSCQMNRVERQMEEGSFFADSAGSTEPHLDEAFSDAKMPSRALDWLAKEVPKTVSGDSKKTALALPFDASRLTGLDSASTAHSRGLFAVWSRNAGASFEFEANAAFREKQAGKVRENRAKNPRMTFWSAAREVMGLLGEKLAQGIEQATSDRALADGAWAWRPNKENSSSFFLSPPASSGLAPSTRDDDLSGFFLRETAAFAPLDPLEKEMLDLGAGCAPSTENGRLAAWNNLFDSPDALQKNASDHSKSECGASDQSAQARTPSASISDWDALGSPESRKSWGSHGVSDSSRPQANFRAEMARRAKRTFPRAN